MIVGVASLHGAPGATTLATLLAAVWSDDVTDSELTERAQRRILIEADPDCGSVLVARYPEELSTSPNLSDLMSGGRHGFDEEATWRQVQQLPGIGDVIVAAPHPSVSSRLVQRLDARALAEVMPGVDLIFDLGRRRPQSQMLADQMDLVVIAVKRDFEGLAPLLAQQSEIAAGAVPCGVVLCGTGYGVEEVQDALDEVPVVGEVPWAPEDARIWNADPTKNRPIGLARWLTKSPLVAQGRNLAAAIQSLDAVRGEHVDD